MYRIKTDLMSEMKRTLEIEMKEILDEKKSTKTKQTCEMNEV